MEQALHLVSDASDERVAPAVPEPVAPSSDRRSTGGVILPFWPVLLWGEDVGDPEGPDPSVFYARLLYVQLSLNWLIDVAGLTNLVLGYLPGRAFVGARVGVAVAVAAVLSGAFVTFAVALVKTPLRAQRVQRNVLVALSVLTAVSGVSVVAGWVWTPHGDDLWTFVVRLGSVGLAGCVCGVLCSVFGVRIGALVAARTLFMLGVGWLVAEPLHEAMFASEIFEEHRRGRLVQIEDELAAAQHRGSGERDACLRARAVPEEGCGAIAAELKSAAVLLDVAALRMREEATGRCEEQTRNDLAKAGIKDLSVLALLGRCSGVAKQGSQFTNAARRHRDAEGSIATLTTEHGACKTAVTECASAGDGTSQRTDLTVERDALRAATLADTQLGAIERAVAFEALVTRAGAQGDLVRRKIFPAWFMALAIPGVFLMTRLTAGPKYENYVARRWAGR